MQVKTFSEGDLCLKLVDVVRKRKSELSFVSESQSFTHPPLEFEANHCLLTPDLFTGSRDDFIPIRRETRVLLYSGVQKVYILVIFK
jgi:hypothetical protein